MKKKCTQAMVFAIANRKNLAIKKQLLFYFLWVILTCCITNGGAQNYNTAYGVDALDQNTSGNYNSAFGWMSLNKNTTGNFNTGHGWHSLYSNVNGLYNTAIGTGALNYNTTSYNTALGYYSLWSNTTGANNTAAGYRSLWSNKTGHYNTANGFQSMATNIDGSRNTAIGSYSLYTNNSGIENTANGYASLISNTSGSQNTALGINSLYSNTTGYTNTALGSNSLLANTTGVNNTATGCGSLTSNTIGWANTAGGYNSLKANTTGNANTAYGYESLITNTGNNNTANGFQSLFNNSTGTANTAIGWQSLNNNTTGSNNTALGFGANVSTGNLTNATAIGHNSIATASNQVMLGNSAVTSIRLSSTTGSKFLEFFRGGSSSNQTDWRFDHNGSSLFVSSSSNDFASSCNIVRFGMCSDPFKFTVFGSALVSGGTWQTSDLKLKKDINEFNSALDIIKQLKPKTYFFKTDEYNGLNLSVSKQYGFVAQDFEKVLPELVRTSHQPVRVNTAGERQVEDLKAVNYTELIPILTKAIQEQQKQIEELSQTVEMLIQQQPAKKRVLAESAKTNVMITNVTLAQNHPNPFANTTSIRYDIPGSTKNAQLVISDNSGKIVKQTTLNAKTGVVNIDASLLSSGTYNYTLLVDGKQVESKKMVVVH